jgi:dTDP-4-dehydrorhamnose reductase
VFDGEKQWPYTEEDSPSPINFYGRTKAQAEEAVLSTYPDALVVRTSAFFGPWDHYNFAHAVRQNLHNEVPVHVASDAVVSPTYVPDLVHATLDLLVDREKGIWHLANDGELSWLDFACEIADRFGLNRKYINAIPTAEFNFAARRPLYSVLSSSRGILLPRLENALRRYTEEVNVHVQRERQVLKDVRA